MTMELVQEAAEVAAKAVNFDGAGDLDAATYYYQTAATLLSRAAAEIAHSEADDSDGQKQQRLLAKAAEYRRRSDEIQESRDVEAESSVEIEENARIVQRARFLLQQALEEDEAGGVDAIELYAKAVDFIRQSPDVMEGVLRDLCLQALERAETLKAQQRRPPHQSKSISTPSLFKSPSTSMATSSSGGDIYTAAEKSVLLHTSRINNREFVPFMLMDLRERFHYPLPFTDPDGLLALSPKQREKFARWMRASELSRQPSVVAVGAPPNYLAIKQTVVSDCSLVASLAVAASYESRFGRPLVTTIIYPRAADQRPRFNPFGKYMVKLYVNGVARKVIIDDQLPVDRYGRLLCSYSSNSNEFWVSLLEKAYMKMMGGYDFPGSNSNIDLYALTGWIPERIPIQADGSGGDFNKDAFFTTLEERMHRGDVLVTVATGPMSDAQAERTGLVASHAYAVMTVRTVNGVRLLKLKNPWSHVRWRGNYSELDGRHWTRDLQTQLRYDPNSAAQFDNGVFWIDYDSVCAFFYGFYMSWSPEMFPYTYCTHHEWKACSGPIKDLYTIGANPQYSLRVEGGGSGAVWLHLCRHITDVADFRDNAEFIALMIYNTSSGKRVYYPFDPPPYIDGVRINSPHYLCKIIQSATSQRSYTVVVTQYEKSTTIYYTLRAYSTCPFRLDAIEECYRFRQEVTGDWRGHTAGGCPNYPATYRNNPRFRLDVAKDSDRLLIELKGPKQYSLGVDVKIVRITDAAVTAPFRSKSSGDYRHGYVALELEAIPGGSLEIVVSTYSPGQEGPFILTVQSANSSLVLHQI